MILCSVHNSIFSPQRYENFCIHANKWRKSRHFSLENGAERLQVRGYRREVRGERLEVRGEEKKSPPIIGGEIIMDNKL